MQTITEAYAAWTQIEAQRQVADDGTCDRLASELCRIEEAAVRLPVTTAQDLWRLMAMTVAAHEDPTIIGETLFHRARTEATLTEESPLATIFDQWLPAARRSADGTATDAEVEQIVDLVDRAAELRTTGPLDLWRKVAMVLDVTDHRHAGATAALMREARAVLGIEAPTQH